MKFLKRFWIDIVLVAMLMACGWQAPSLMAGTLTVNATFDYSSTNSIDSAGNYPACSATVTTNCVTGFKIYNTTTGTATLVGTMPNASTPSGIQTIVTSFTVNNPIYGTNTIDATTAYLDSSGTAMESAPSAPASFVVPSPGAKSAAITAAWK